MITIEELLSRQEYVELDEKKSEQKKVIRQRLKDRNKEFVWLYKLDNPCIVCREKDPRVLEFHHRNPEEKEATISYLIKSQASLVRLQEEIDKCDVLCANCHKKVHWYGYCWSWNYF